MHTLESLYTFDIFTPLCSFLYPIPEDTQAGVREVRLKDNVVTNANCPFREMTALPRTSKPVD